MAKRDPLKPESTAKSEPLASAVALVQVPGGGWVCRTFLVPLSAVAYSDSTVDTFGAALGRATRELAKEARG